MSERTSGSTAFWGLLATCLTLSSQAAAQEPARSGFSAELAAGPFLSRVSCTSCEEVTTTSSSGGFLRIGVALNGRVMLALESMAQSTESFAGDDADNLLVEKVNLSGIVLWFPWQSGFFAKAGVGTSNGTVTVEPEGRPPVVTSGTGVGITAGVGWDLPITSRLSITLNVGGWISALGDVVLPTRVVDDVIDSTYGFTLGLTLR